MNTLPAREIEPTLADAFSTFAAAAGQLEGSYRELQTEIMRLRLELEARNAAMAETLTENQSMRVELRRILDTLPCGVVVLGPAGEVVFLNLEARRQLDACHLAASRSEAADQPSDDETLLSQLSSQAIPGGAEQEVPVSGPTGTMWLAIRSSHLNSSCPILTPSRRSSGKGRVVLISRDVTAQKRLQQDRDETQHLIALAKMSAVLAHEIRNPLASMELLAGLLCDCDALNLEQHSWIDTLRAGVRSLSATVNNVLRYHSLGASALTPVQLSHVLREAVQFVQPLAKQKGIDLVLEDELRGHRIEGNLGELQQVLFNLTLNAFRHTRRGGIVMVKAAKESRGSSVVAVVEVNDNGEGIRAADMPRLFEAGFSATGQNPGLGLAVCKKIVELHHGTISVSSQVGVGSSFRMEFPLHD